MARMLRALVDNLPIPHSARDEGLRRRLLGAFPYRLLLRAGFKLKIFGANEKDGAPVASRGTSIPNTVVATAGMGSCIGVAVGGENIKDGKLHAGAKTRVFHIFTLNN
jgi:hypothetical protein